MAPNLWSGNISLFYEKEGKNGNAVSKPLGIGES